MKYLPSSYSVLCILILVLNGCKESCDDWYEGDECDVEIRSDHYGNFVGEFAGTIAELFGEHTAVISVFAHPDDVTMLQLVSSGYVDTFSVTLLTRTTFEIPPQAMVVGGFQLNGDMEGTGSFEGDQLTFSIRSVSDDPSTVALSFIGVD